MSGKRNEIQIWYSLSPSHPFDFGLDPQLMLIPITLVVAPIAGITDRQ